MKITLLIVTLLFIVFIFMFLLLAVMSRSGTAPGLVEGKLSNCPASPNCVCSEQAQDSQHYSDAIIIPDNIRLDQRYIIKNIIADMGGTIQIESDNYLAATFSSAVFGFVDDLEIRIDATSKKIHFRSSSRVGHNDAGVNKRRIKLLKKRYTKKYY